MVYYSRSENQNGEKELLIDHLNRTSELCEGFADDFGCGAAGSVLGKFHDLGKATEKFQDVLKGKCHGINHAGAGAVLIAANEKRKNIGSMLSDIVYAHHSRLEANTNGQFRGSLSGECVDSVGKRFSACGKDEYRAILDYCKQNGIVYKKPNISFTYDDTGNTETMLLYRMLYSCLVDADWSASAEHKDKNYLVKSSGGVLNCDRLIAALEEYRNGIIANSHSADSMNVVRNELFEQCCLAGENEPPGLFTLTAPTGAGKTLAMLAFALYHAKKQGKRRIIFVLPFLSIIEQNAEVYRKICSETLEIHSQTEYPEEMREMSDRFDAPIIVTTSVRFFETLFRNKPRDCRCLHNFSDSVIIFDEAQTLPIGLAKATLQSVNALCGMFNSTVVFSTATQPPFQYINGLQWQPREITREKDRLFSATKRTVLKMDISLPKSFEKIAEEICALDSVCCIVNKKAHSYTLFQLVNESDPESCFHISTDLCAAHRKRVVGEIRRRLSEGKPCRVVSTSCIEAGVDLDFKNIFRALAPLEAIVQSAGRCNRNGCLSCESGNVTVFLPKGIDGEKSIYPTEWYGFAAETVRVVASRHPIDIDNPEHIEEYYRTLFPFSESDKKLDDAISDLDFSQVSKQYKFIDNSAVNILVPYSECIEEYNSLKREAVEKGINNSWVRRAAHLSVTSYDRDTVDRVCEAVRFAKGDSAYSGWYILNDSCFYDDKAGFHIDSDSCSDYIL